MPRRPVAVWVLNTYLLMVACVGVGALLSPIRAADWGEWYGPAWTEFKLTYAEGRRVEAAGPFWAREWRWPEGEAPAADATELPVSRLARTLTLAPLFNWSHEPGVENVSWDCLYPVITYDRYGPEWRLQVFQLLRFTGGATQEAASTRSFTLVPFFWFRRSAQEPALNYSAVWPFYGSLQKRLFRDEVRFVMWPTYVQTRRRGVVTDNYLAPFVHIRRGDGLRGWQVWPFYGTEHQAVTTRTNGFGEVETAPGHASRFVLWPFYSAAELGVGSTNPITQRTLLPFLSLHTSPARDRSLYAWPFGPVFLRDRERDYRQVSFLFPLFAFARGPGKQAARVWPLYGITRYPESQSQFAAWPLYLRKDTRSEGLERHTTRVGLFLYTDLETRDRRTGQTVRRTDLWPLFAARRDRAGNERFQVLALLEPLLPANESIRRLYSPLWALWRSEHRPATGTQTRALLWNLYREERRPGAKKCSLLFGLFQYESTPAGQRGRLLFVPWGRRPAPTPTAAPPH